MSVRVDFYLLNRPGLVLESVLATLVKKAWHAGFKISILGESLEQLETLDESLWQSKGFLAHDIVTTGKPGSAPVTLALVAEGLHELVINLAAKPLVEANNLQRVLEIVPNENTLREQSRIHYRHYRQLGWSLNMHKIN